MTDDRVSPTLTLTIEAEHELRADLTAAAIARLSSHFDAWQRRRNFPVEARLRIAGLRSGSVITQLIAVADAANKLYENIDVAYALRDMLGAFYKQLFDAFEIVAGLRTGKIGAPERKTLEVIAAPTIEDNAKRVTLHFHGNNNVIVLGDVEAYELQHLEGTVRRRARRPSKALNGKTLTAGRLSSVDGKWYVRVRGEKRPVPASGGTVTDVLDSSREYDVAGWLHRYDGAAISFEVSDIDQ